MYFAFYHSNMFSFCFIFFFLPLLLFLILFYFHIAISQSYFESLSRKLVLSETGFNARECDIRSLWSMSSCSKRAVLTSLKWAKMCKKYYIIKIQYFCSRSSSRRLSQVLTRLFLSSYTFSLARNMDYANLLITGQK